MRCSHTRSRRFQSDCLDLFSKKCEMFIAFYSVHGDFLSLREVLMINCSWRPVGEFFMPFIFCMKRYCVLFKCVLFMSGYISKHQSCNCMEHCQLKVPLFYQHE